MEENPRQDGNSVLLLDTARGMTAVLVAPNASNGSISPAGRWIAYTARETTPSQVVVQPIPPDGSKWQVTSDGGGGARWRGDGRELFFTSGDRMMSVDVDPSSSTLHVGTPRYLFDIHLPRGRVSPRNFYAVAGNGQRFPVDTVVEEATSASINIVVNRP